MTAAEILDQIATSGLRLTGPRRAVIHALEEGGCLQSVEETHARARRLHHGVGLVTVYRVLELLRDRGLVHEVHLGDGRARYELTDAGPRHHHHLICLSCGRVETLRRCLIASVPLSAAEGFRVTGHRLDLYGYCRACGGST